MANRFKYLALMLAAAAASPAVAQTTTHTIKTTGSNADNGKYGNSLTFSASDDASLKVKVTGWQANQTTNAITSAYVGAYGGGVGITGLGDNNGGGAFHQIDNVLGYTDFVLLQFNRAVSLTGVNTNLYQMTGVDGVDGDFTYWDAGALSPSKWDAVIDMTQYSARGADLFGTNVSHDGGFKAISPGTASNLWLVGASFQTSDRDDGFKLAQLTATEKQVAAVPEPATWAMMLLGFGVVGSTMRRGKRSADMRRAAIA